MAKMQYWTTKELIYLCGRYEIEDKKELALKMNRKYTSLLQKVHALRRTGEYDHYKKLACQQSAKPKKTKRCSTCKTKYPLSTVYFYRQTRAHDGLQANCKNCIRAYQAKWRKKKQTNEAVSLFNIGDTVEVKTREGWNGDRNFFGKVIGVHDKYIVIYNGKYRESFTYNDIKTGDVVVKKT